MNNAQQTLALVGLFLSLVLIFTLMPNTEAMQSKGPGHTRNFQASSDVPVERTDKPATMELRDSKATSYYPPCSFCNHTSHTDHVMDNPTMNLRDNKAESFESTFRFDD